MYTKTNGTYDTSETNIEFFNAKIWPRKIKAVDKTAYVGAARATTKPPSVFKTAWYLGNRYAIKIIKLDIIWTTRYRLNIFDKLSSYDFRVRNNVKKDKDIKQAVNHTTGVNSE